MKHSWSWLMLILIASTVILGISSDSKDGLPAYYQAHKAKSHSGHEHHKPTPLTTIGDQSDPVPAAKPSNQYTYNYNYYPPSESPPVWFQILTTVVLLAFSGGLWWTSIQQWRSTRDAADAAKQSAQAAYAAIATGRPYIQAIQITLDEAAVMKTGIKWETERIKILVPAPIVVLKNCGRSPAIIRSIICSFEPENCEDYDTRRHADHVRLQPDWLFNEVGSSRWFIAAEQSIRQVIVTKDTEGWSISPEQFKRMHEMEWTLVAYGRVEYEDTLGNKTVYTTDFCWILQPDFEHIEAINLYWIKGPDEHNRYT